MSTEMLYRKYRPQSLRDVFGQEKTIKTLQKSVKEKNIAHAYLLSGSRGIGKTTIARCFAKELEIQEGDILEIDAASNSKVEDIRELGEGLHSLPFYSPFKMYILDEVHMLSKNAVNAFLKILEEPPKHVIFVLATTAPEKLPDTILSRCMHFQLERPTQANIIEKLKEVADKENRGIDAESLVLISKIANGSYRDALVVLQKVFSGQDSLIDFATTLKVLNLPRYEISLNYLYALNINKKQDLQIALQGLEEMRKTQADVEYFTENLVDFLRLVLFLRFDSSYANNLNLSFSKDVQDIASKIAKDKNSKINSGTLNSILEASIKSKKLNQKTLPFEILLLS